MDWWIVLLLLAAAAGVFLWVRARGAHWRAAALRRRYRRRLHMPKDLAETVIEENLDRLRQRHPGRSETWYLEKMLYELDRDRG